MSDTTAIIIAIVGTGVTLLGVLSGLMVFLFRLIRQDIAELRQDMAELRQDVRAVNARIDTLYHFLLNRPDTAA